MKLRFESTIFYSPYYYVLFVYKSLNYFSDCLSGKKRYAETLSESATNLNSKMKCSWPFVCSTAEAFPIVYMYIHNQACGLKLPRKPYRLTRLLQMTGRWQYKEIMWSALHSVKSINVDFLNQIHFFSIKSYLIVLTRLGGPCSRLNPHLKS